MNKIKTSLVVLATLLGNIGVAAADCSVGVSNMGSFFFPLVCDSGNVRGVAYGTQGSSIVAGLYGNGNFADSYGYTIGGAIITGCYAQDFNEVPGQDATDSTGCGSATKQDLFLDT